MAKGHSESTTARLLSARDSTLLTLCPWESGGRWTLPTDQEQIRRVLENQFTILEALAEITAKLEVP